MSAAGASLRGAYADRYLAASNFWWTDASV